MGVKRVIKWSNMRSYAKLDQHIFDSHKHLIAAFLSHSKKQDIERSFSQLKFREIISEITIDCKDGRPYRDLELRWNPIILDR